MLAEHEQVHQTLVRVFNLEFFEGQLVLLVGFGSLHDGVLILQNPLLNLPARSLGNLDLIPVLVLNSRELIDKILRMLGGEVVVLCHVLGGAAESEKVRVKRRHLWLDVVEQERLDQMGPVNLERDFLKEVLHIQVVLSDDINHEVVLDRLVAIQLQSIDRTSRESEALEWVETVLRLRDVIYDHDGVWELAVCVDKVLEVGHREGETLLAAHVETGVALVIRSLLTLWTDLYVCLCDLKVSLIDLLHLFDVAENFAHDSILGVSIDSGRLKLLILAVLHQAEESWCHDDDLGQVNPFQGLVLLFFVLLNTLFVIHFLIYT